MRVNSSHSIGTLQTVPRAGESPKPQSPTLAVVKGDRRITEIKRIQSNSTELVKASAETDTEEQGIRVFQMNELNRKSCC